MDDALACIDGKLVAEAEASIPVTDHGLIRGDGAFEVMRLYGGRPYALDAHFERLAGSAARLRLTVDLDALRGDVAMLLSACKTADALVRVMATRGGHRITLIEPVPEIPDTLALEPISYAPTRILDGIKSLSYAANMLATRLARERGADEALLVTPHGRVLECPTASFFAVFDGEVWTAPLSDHILDSITRRVVLSVAAVREEPIAYDSLERASEAFVSSTVEEAAPVARVGEHRFDAPGERTLELARLVRERIAAELG